MTADATSPQRLGSESSSSPIFAGDAGPVQPYEQSREGDGPGPAHRFRRTPGGGVRCGAECRIDGVSGATVTSDGYRESLQAALDAAHLR